MNAIPARRGRSLDRFERGATPGVERRMESKPYIPPDPTCIELNKPEAVDFWSRTLETSPERLREAAQKAGPLVEDVKKELGIAGAG